LIRAAGRSAPHGRRFRGAAINRATSRRPSAYIVVEQAPRADADDALPSRNGHAMNTTTDDMLVFLDLCDPDSEAAALALLDHEFPEAPTLERQEAARVYVLERRRPAG
jgi:hypothetical protein